MIILKKGNRKGMMERNQREWIKKADEEIPAFFYIPDISGFTAFINEANPQEGARIIHDLLEVIIDSNILDLKVAEIQGDSIWFYKFGDPLDLFELERQTVKTFTDFQNALGELEEKYVYLSKARDLTLKILVHYGKVSATEVKGTLKLIGTDSVIAHRIMKNNISGHEYLLMTRQYLDTQKPALRQTHRPFFWNELKNGRCYYDHLGFVEFKYADLHPLKERIKIA